MSSFCFQRSDKVPVRKGISGIMKSRTRILQYSCTKMAGPSIGSAILKEDKRIEKSKRSIGKEMQDVSSFGINSDLKVLTDIFFLFKMRNCDTTFWPD